MGEGFAGMGINHRDHEDHIAFLGEKGVELVVKRDCQEDAGEVIAPV